MATAPESPSDPTPSPSVPAPRPARGGLGVFWLTMALLLLGASGLVRAWQDHQLAVIAETAETAPFTLADLPRDLGRWKALGPDETLDPQTLEIAGASDYVARSYTDERTGVVLSLLVVFGPAERIVGHVPEVCFPATGYNPASAPSRRMIPLDSGPVEFRAASFVKGQGPTLDLQEAYYSFLHAGRWSPTTAETRKLRRIRPATFKVQVQRRIGEAESRDLNNPIESLLMSLLPELERRIAAANASQDQG